MVYRLSLHGLVELIPVSTEASQELEYIIMPGRAVHVTRLSSSDEAIVTLGASIEIHQYHPWHSLLTTIQLSSEPCKEAEPIPRILKEPRMHGKHFLSSR
jgi:hypothetical protein